MTRFRIDDSFALKTVGFVFSGEILEGSALPDMIFFVTEAGHRWRIVVRSVECIFLTGGGKKTGLVVEQPKNAYLPGLGVGQTVELIEAEEDRPNRTSSPRR